MTTLKLTDYEVSKVLHSLVRSYYGFQEFIDKTGEQTWRDLQIEAIELITRIEEESGQLTWGNQSFKDSLGMEILIG